MADRMFAKIVIGGELPAEHYEALRTLCEENVGGEYEIDNDHVWNIMVYDAAACQKVYEVTYEEVADEADVLVAEGSL